MPDPQEKKRMASPCPSCGFPRSESKDGSTHCPVCILDSDAVGLDRLLPDLAAEIRAGFQAVQSRAEEAGAERWASVVDAAKDEANRHFYRAKALQQAIQEVEEELAERADEAAEDETYYTEHGSWGARCGAEDRARAYQTALDLLRSKVGRDDG